MKTIIALWLLAVCAIGGDTTMTGPLCEYRTRVIEWVGLGRCHPIPGNLIAIKCESDTSWGDRVWFAPCKGRKP